MEVPVLERPQAARLLGMRPPAGGLLVAALVVSRLPAGLGLPCPLRSLTGVPCPFCGTTTSVRAALNLDLAGALSANPMGVLLLLAALVILFTGGLRMRVPVAVLVMAGLALEAFQLHRFEFL